MAESSDFCSDMRFGVSQVMGRDSKIRVCMALAVAFVTLAIRLPLMSRPGYPSDMAQFVMWGTAAKHMGVESLYRQRPDGKRIANYPPIYLFILKQVARVHDATSLADQQLSLQTMTDVANSQATPEARNANFFFKFPAVMADSITAALLLIWLSRRLKWGLAILVAGIYAICPAVWHNSALWGQVDSITTLLMLVSLEAAVRRRWSWMIFWAALAVLFKAQAAMLFPIWAIGCLYGAREKSREVLHGCAMAAALVLIVLGPLRNHLDGVWDAYAGAAKYYPYTHLNGFSLWFWLDPIDREHLRESLSQYYIADNTWGMLVLPPRLWGMILLAGSWAYASWQLWRSKFDSVAVRWTACMLPLAFFCFSTQMHERYLFPAFGIWAWAARPQWDWWVGWFVVGLVAYLNASWVWTGPIYLGNYSEWLTNILHVRWAGILPGVWCATALGIVLLWTLIIPRRDKSHAPANG